MGVEGNLPQPHPDFPDDARHCHRHCRSYRADGNRQRREGNAGEKHRQHGREHNPRLARDYHKKRRKLWVERQGEHHAHRRRRNQKGLSVGRVCFARGERARADYLRRKKLESVQHYRRQRRLPENRELVHRGRRADRPRARRARLEGLSRGVYDCSRAFRRRKSRRQGFAHSECRLQNHRRAQNEGRKHDGLRPGRHGNRAVDYRENAPARRGKHFA